MNIPEVHLWTIELVADQGLVRYSCRSCGRCMEDGPDGLRLLTRGDTEVVHHGGSLSEPVVELQQHEPPPTVMH